MKDHQPGREIEYPLPWHERVQRMINQIVVVILALHGLLFIINAIGWWPFDWPF